MQCEVESPGFCGQRADSDVSRRTTCYLDAICALLRQSRILSAWEGAVPWFVATGCRGAGSRSRPGAPALAHHSFAAEFDANASAELEGEIAQVWFNNPHVRLRARRRRATTARPSTGSCRRASVTALQARLDRQDAQARRRVKVSGQLGRDGAKKLYCAHGRARGRHEARDRPRQPIRAGPEQGPCDPADVRLRRGAQQLSLRHHGAWRNATSWHLTVDDLDAQAHPVHGRRPQGVRIERSLAGPVAAVPARRAAADLRRAVRHGGRRRRQSLHLHLRRAQHAAAHLDGRPQARQPIRRRRRSASRSVIGRATSLVIETTHLAPGWLDGSGLPMKGEGTRVVERYDFAADKLSMERTMTIYDPYYTQPLVRKRGSARDDSVDIARASHVRSGQLLPRPSRSRPARFASRRELVGRNTAKAARTRARKTNR